MTTANDLCAEALRKAGVLGVGQTASAEDSTYAFNDLIRMLRLWQSSRWISPALTGYVFTATGARSYSVGLQADIDIVRPNKIEDVFINLGTNDYRLQQIDTRQEYNEISYKGLVSFPTAYYYNPSAPNGELFIWPIPTQQYRVHMFVPTLLAGFTNRTSQFTMPAEYEEAILYNLVVRICASYGMEPTRTQIQLAKNALETIKSANMQVRELETPPALSWGWRSGGNAWWGSFAGVGAAQDSTTPAGDGTTDGPEVVGSGLTGGAGSITVTNVGGVAVITDAQLAMLPTSPPAGPPWNQPWNNGGLLSLTSPP